MKTFSKQQIEHLLDKTEDFHQAITDSKGFILYLCDQFNITLPKKLLLDTLNIYSVQYIAEHIDTLELSKTEKTRFMAYLTEDKEDEETFQTNKNYSLDDLLNDLNNNDQIHQKQLMHNIHRQLKASKLRITSDDFLNHTEQLSLLLNNEDSVRYAAYFTDGLLSDMFKNMSKETFLKIDYKYLNLYPCYFNMARHLLEDSDIKQLYTQSLTAFYDQDQVKESGYGICLDSYKNYPFNTDEKELFLKLLKKTDHKSYGNVRSLIGFDNLFALNDYVLEHHIEDLALLSEKDIEKNIDKIREQILKNYQRLETLFHLTIEESDLNKIFSDEFLISFIQKNGLQFSSYDKNNTNAIKKMQFFYSKIVRLCATNDELLDQIQFSTIVEHITQIHQKDDSLLTLEELQNFEAIVKKFPVAIQTKNLFKNLKHSKYHYLYSNLPVLIVDSMKDKQPTINYLYFLSVVVKEYAKQNPFVFKKELQRIVPLLPKNEVQQIEKILNYSLDTITENSTIKTTSLGTSINQKIKKVTQKIAQSLNESDNNSSNLISNMKSHNANNDFSDNFLLTNPNNIRSLSLEQFEKIFFIDDRFKQMILKNNLDDVFIDFCERIKKEEKSDLIRQSLNTLTEKNDTFYFFKQFIQKNIDYILNNNLNELITHPLREQLIKIDTSKIEKDSFKKMEALLEHYFFTTNAYREIGQKTDVTTFTNSNEKKFKLLLKEKEALEEIFKELKTTLSFQFFNEQLKLSNMVQAVRLFIVNNKKEYLNTVLDKFYHLNFEDTMKSIENPEVLRFIYNKKQKRDDKSESYFVINPTFSDEQNKQIVEKLLQNFNNRELFSENYKTHISLDDVLYVIDKKRVVDISNELAVKHDPLEMFNSYTLSINSYFESHVKKTYSTEQILQAIANLKQQGLTIFGKKETNSSYEKCLRSNYEQNDNNLTKDKSNPHLKDYLNLLKNLENDPINYLAVCHHDIIKNFIVRNNDLYSEVLITDFVNTYINMDVVLQAFQQIVNLQKNYEQDLKTNNLTDDLYQGVFLKDGIKAIDRFISYTHYHNSQTGKYESHLDDDKAYRIIDFVCQQAPYLALSISSVGKIDVENYINKNFERCFPNPIESFFESNGQDSIRSDHLTLSYQKNNQDMQWQSKKAYAILEKMKDNIQNNGDENYLYQLDYILKTIKFNEHRPYGKGIHDFSTSMTQFLDNEYVSDMIKYHLTYLKTVQLEKKLTTKNSSTESKKYKI